jgi:transposase
MLPTAGGRDPCPFCGAIEDAVGDPVVSRLAARLADELTVWRLRRETPPAILARLHPTLAALPLDRLAPKTRNALRAAILAELAGGPMRATELARAVYPATADPALRAANDQAARQLCCKMVKQGQLLRVGRGWYALPGATDGMADRGRAELERALGHPKVRGRGVTMAVLAETFGRDESTIYYWLRRIEADGLPLRRRTTYAGRGGARVVRYWLADPADAAPAPSGVEGCRRRLERAPIGGWTVAELAEVLGTTEGRVYTWFAVLRRAGHGLRSRPASRDERNGRRSAPRRWWIEDAPARQGVA